MTEEILKQLVFVRTPTDRKSLVFGGWHGSKGGILLLGNNNRLLVEWGTLQKHKYLIPLSSIIDWNKRPYGLGPLQFTDVFTIIYLNEEKWKTKIEIGIKKSLISFGKTKGNLEEYLMNFASKNKDVTSTVCSKCNVLLDTNSKFCSQCGKERS